MKPVVIIATVAILFGAAALPVSAGELTRGVWRSDQCAKPIAPPTDRTDTQALNLSVANYNDYVREVERYVACLKTEAQEDMRLIQDGFNAAQDEVQLDADAARPRGTEVK
ncbi:MAG: hypothetical protein FJX66_16325 [Alphaproteobacteria bacterium]|nr:hypothetical protein [Alphaproteobacteria bacterium]